MTFIQIRTLVLALIGLLPASSAKEKAPLSQLIQDYKPHPSDDPHNLTSFINIYSFFSMIANYIVEHGLLEKMDLQTKIIIHIIFNLTTLREGALKESYGDFFQLVGTDQFGKEFQKFLNTYTEEDMQEEFDETLDQIPKLVDDFEMDGGDLLAIISEKPDAKKIPILRLKDDVTASESDGSIEVQQDTGMVCARDKQLFTHGLSCCVAIGIVSEELHALSHDADNLIGRYKKMRKELKDRSATSFQTFLVGGDCDIGTLRAIENLLAMIMYEKGNIPSCQLILYDGIAPVSCQLSRKGLAYAFESPSFAIKKFMVSETLASSSSPSFFAHNPSDENGSSVEKQKVPPAAAETEDVSDQEEYTAKRSKNTKK